MGGKEGQGEVHGGTGEKVADEATGGGEREGVRGAIMGEGKGNETMNERGRKRGYNRRDVV